MCLCRGVYEWEGVGVGVSVHERVRACMSVCESVYTCMSVCEYECLCVGGLWAHTECAVTGPPRPPGT